MDLGGVLLTDNVGENGTIWIHSRGVLQGEGERDVCQRIRGEPESRPNRGISLRL
jgi:hypothetical protein